MACFNQILYLGLGFSNFLMSSIFSRVCAQYINRATFRKFICLIICGFLYNNGMTDGYVSGMLYLVELAHEN